MTWPAFSRHHDQEERGAIALMAALLMVSVLAFTAFAVDLGLQRAAARDMQAVADAVALDTARDPGLASCNQTALSAAAAKSLTRQGASIGRSAPLVVTPGHISPTTKQFVAGSNAGACDAVRVVASTTVDFAFAPVIGTSSGSAARAAVGSTDSPAVCFSAGTTALVLNPAGTALGSVLKNILNINLGLVGYDSGLVGLHGLSIPIADLDAAFKLGTGHALLDNANVSLAGVLLASASVLEQQGNAVRAQVLRTLAANVGALTVNVSKFLSVGTGGAAGLTATVDALDFIGDAIVTAAIANGKNALNISQLGLTVAGISLVDAKVTVIEPPVIACGKVGVQAKTAQVRVDLKTGVNVLGIASAADISLGVRVAQGSATLTGVNCAAANPTATISGSTSAASVVGYGGTGPARLNIVTLGLLGVTLGLGLQGSVASGSSDHTFTYPPASPPPGLPATYSYGSPANLNLAITPDSLLGLGLLLGAVVNPVLAVVNTAVGTLLTGVLGLLGVKLGTMDVTMLGRPSCNGVRLVG